jgi:tetratricopeptide (TPR) repeat protein
MDRSAALRPLTAAAGPIRELREYDTDARLNAAVAAVADAVEQSLRLALNTDGSAPEDHRLSALSSNALSLEQVLQSLRARDRIALETAGSVHALDAAGDRARAGHARDSDADLAADAVTRLRADLASDPTPDPEAAGTGAAPAVGEDRSGTAPMPAPSASPSARLRGRRRSMAWVGSGLALLFLIGLAWVLSSGGEDHYRAGLAAFRSARWDSAAVSFERVVQDRPVDVTAMLYLARSYRRLGRLEEAAGVLRDAARVAPRDGDVQRELGHLFMDLERPGPAVRHYERALELDPESRAAWAGLIRALRATDDPRADQLLERAPPDVRSAPTPGNR